jgi:hypothetical protein
MKKIPLLVIGLTIAFTVQAQTTLKYKTHGLLPNEKNPMLLTKYLEPGPEGQNVVWDFTTLEATNNFTGNVNDSYIAKNLKGVESANIALEEFGNYFFFNSNSSQLEQYGYSSSNGNVAIVYSKPFIKMRYPFSYISFYNGPFEGTYIVNEKTIGDIAGNYQVAGDATGTLLLPDGKSFQNALRVKEIKSYKQTINGVATNIEEVSYRWYVNEHRFPILVLINCTYKFENGQSSVTTKAAYNSNVIIPNSQLPNKVSEIQLDVYPNPYHERVNINIRLEERSKVTIVVFDLIGKRISVLADKYEEAGELKYNFSAGELGLAKGTYIIKVRVNNNETTRKIMEI